MGEEDTTLIVGAGPTGLTLAIELQRADLPFRLIDKASGPAQHSQALGVQARTLEQFERYGLVEQFLARGRQARSFTASSEGKTLVSLDFSKIPGRYPFGLMIPQSTTEAILANYLAQHGGRIERGVELVQCENALDHVKATLAHATGRVEQVTVTWLAGCDGARSKVRAAMATPFPGEAEPLQFYLADLELSGPNVPDEDLHAYLHDGRALFVARWGEKRWRLVVIVHQQEGPRITLQPTLDDFQTALDEFVGGGITASNPIWMTPFHVNERMAEHYRTDSMFLLGDAAHIHSPVAGQGMNTGIQDAANLGWKLAAVHRGADPNLLSSYEEERSAIGKVVLRATSEGLSALTTTNPLLRSLRDLFVPIVTKWPTVQRAAMGFVSETALDYRHSSIVRETVDSGVLRAGDRVPNPEIYFRHHRPQRMLESMKDDAHLALGINIKDEASFAVALPGLPHLFLTTVPTDSTRAGWSDGVIGDLFGHEPQIVLVRPDGYIGLRCLEQDAESLEQYSHVVGLPAARLTAHWH